jgi:hypothetical protein
MSSATTPKLRRWLHTVTSPLALAVGVVLIALARAAAPLSQQRPSR